MPQQPYVCVCVSWVYCGAAAAGGSSIVVLMPRVVKREHLHNQIIKICIILFFTIRVLLSLSLLPDALLAHSHFQK